tara:strand:- start:466 stop:1152 length:687 start_codon:yes stop_codon:yes gene_type:complete
MKRLSSKQKHQSGLTLIELIVAFSIMMILATIALPLAHVKIQREKERSLRDALTGIRNAIDRYKDMADAGKLGQVDSDTFGYPPTLEILVEGVPIRVGTGRNPFRPNVSQETDLETQGSQIQHSSRYSSTNRQASDMINNPPERGNAFNARSSNSNTSLTQSFGNDTDKQKLRFLRKIPRDPMTGQTDWGIRAVEDDPNAFNWSGKNVFDVYSKSMDLALDGTRYSAW